MEEGTKVTVQVMDEKEQWLDENNWMTDPVSKVKYVEVITSKDGGAYETDLYLDATGIYDCIIASEGYKETFQIIYTNKDENTAAIAAINAAEETELYDILCLPDTAKQLMLAESNLYAAVQSDTTVKEGTLPLQKVAKLVYDYKSETQVQEPEIFSTMMQKAALVVALNGDCATGISDIGLYEDVLELESLGLKEYYLPENALHLTTLLKKNRINTIVDFNTILRDSIIFTNIQFGDNLDNIVKMLKQFSSELGVAEEQITNDSVRSILGQPFSLVTDVGNAIKGYAPNPTPTPRPIIGGGSFGGGGGGGGGAAVAPSVNGTFSDIYENPAGSTEGIIPFVDLEDVSWAKPAINALYTKGIVAGKTKTEFCPNDSITREEFVKLLTAAFSLDVVGSGMQFEDVNETDWYYDYVRSAYYAEIVNGVSETLFGAGQPITRQDIAVMSYRAANISGVEISSKAEAVTFLDEDAIAKYAYEAVKAMQSSGILNGDETGNFRPAEHATRAEAAKIIFSIYQLMKA